MATHGHKVTFGKLLFDINLVGLYWGCNYNQRYGTRYLIFYWFFLVMLYMYTQTHRHTHSEEWVMQLGSPRSPTPQSIICNGESQEIWYYSSVLSLNTSEPGSWWCRFQSEGRRNLMSQLRQDKGVNFSFLQLVLPRPSTHWMMLTYIVEGNLL